MSELLEIFEKLPDGVTLHDPDDGTILQANQQFCNMLGYSEEELQELSFNDIHLNEPPYTTQRAREYIQKAATEGPQTFEWRDETKAGEVLPVEVNLRVTTIDGEDRILAVVRDISERKERERELEQSHELTQALSTTFPDYTFVYNEEGEYLDVITGWGEGPDYYTPEELIGSSVEEIVDKETAERIKATISEALDAGSLQTIKYPIETPGGTYWYEANLAPLSEGYEGEQAVVLTARDITERIQRERELEASRERYRRLIETAPTPIFIYSDKSELIYANDAAVEFLGADERVEVIGSTAGDFTHPDSEVDVERRRERLVEKRESVPPIEEKLIDVNGEIKYAILASAPVTYEGEPAIQTVATDITEQKRREQELERQNARLDQFAGVISHDLRSPLGVVEGRLNLAREECDSEHLEIAAQQLNRMDELIDDTLTLAQAGETIGDLERVDLPDLAEDCWRSIEAEEATLCTDSEATILADESRLRQLLENLFHNAVRHGGNDVTVRVGHHEPGFFVEDDGSGIPEEERDRIFKAGYSTGDEETGLGLNIVKEIAAAHGWQITVRESQNQGARFEFSGVQFAR